MVVDDITYDIDNRDIEEEMYIQDLEEEAQEEQDIADEAEEQEEEKIQKEAEKTYYQIYELHILHIFVRLLKIPINKLDDVVLQQYINLNQDF